MNTRLRLLILSLVVGLVFLASAVGVMAQQATPTGEIELTGVLESISSGTITVSGQTINIIGAEIRNRLVLGSTVKIHVSEVGGVLTAREVETVSRDDDDDDGSNNNSNNTSNNNSNNTSNNNSNNTSNNNSNNTSNNNSNNTSNNNSNNNDDDDDDNGGVRPTITAQQAIEDVLRVYPTTTIRSVELDTRFGGTLVWEVKIGNGTELVIDAQTGTILVIDRPGDDDDDDDGGRNNNNSNNTSNNNSNNTSNNNSNNNSNDRGDDDDDNGGSNNNSNNNSNDDDDDGGGSGSDNDDNDD